MKDYNLTIGNRGFIVRETEKMIEVSGEQMVACRLSEWRHSRHETRWDFITDVHIPAGADSAQVRAIVADIYPCQAAA